MSGYGAWTLNKGSFFLIYHCFANSKYSDKKAPIV